MAPGPPRPGARGSHDAGRPAHQCPHLAERLEETGAGDELDRLANTLNAMLGRLDEAFRQIRQFSADASHELQTPVTILKGELEVALRMPRSPEAYQRHLQSALEEVERIAILVDGLLLLARADAGVLRMDRQPVDLAQLVAEVYDQTSVLAEAQQLTLELGPLDPVTIQGDYERLRRLLLNLVDNGIKYTPPGGRVTLSLHRCGSWASLRVADTGIGLSLAEQQQVFQRFYRTEAARAHNQRGAGLGLCIVQSIAEAHGGHIQIDSTPGHGSTFTVCLPLHFLSAEACVHASHSALRTFIAVHEKFLISDSSSFHVVALYFSGTTEECSRIDRALNALERRSKEKHT